MDLKIQTAKTAIFRNNEHFQFHTEFRDLVTAAIAVRNKITTQFTEYLTYYGDEDIALQKIVKSATTEQIEEADKLRDQTFRGMVETNKAALSHFKPATVTAAKRLKILFDTYGNVNRMPLNEQTSAVYNIVQDLETTYLSDVTTVGLKEWCSTLKAQNASFSTLVKRRNDENAARTELKMKEARAETDRIYNIIVTRINALIVVEGEEVFSAFVKKLNTYIDKYNNAIAQRRGRTAAKKEGDV